MDFSQIKTIYLTGIGGIGISALAQLLAHRGITIVGSDLEKNHVTEMLQKQGIKIVFDQNAENMPHYIDAHIYSPAVPEENPERKYFERKEIESFSYPEALAQITMEYTTIAVSGTNGKTTTTAMLGHIYEELGLDPTVIVGSLVPKWKSNFKAGDSKYLIIEACEHQAHMTQFHTHDAVITNIEEDHLDYYKDINDIISAFQRFAVQNSPDGYVIINADDKNSSQLKLKNVPYITFGIENDAQIQARNIRVEHGKQLFDIHINLKTTETIIENCELHIPGTFNIYNALAACAQVIELLDNPEDFKQAIASFTGTWRRFEKLGTYKGAEVISDYGHHPSAIKATIQATREFYLDKKILLVFQPHQHNRTKNLFKEFTQSFTGADVVILPEIFDVAGREEAHDQNVSSEDIVLALQEQGITARFAVDFNSTKNFIDEFVNEDHIIIVMGAGDVYKIAEEIAQ